MAAANMVCMSNESIRMQQTHRCSAPTGSPYGSNASGVQHGRAMCACSLPVRRPGHLSQPFPSHVGVPP